MKKKKEEITHPGSRRSRPSVRRGPHHRVAGLSPRGLGGVDRHGHLSETHLPAVGRGLVGRLHSRPSWEEYFMDITQLVAKRSTCLRRQVGALLVKDKKILATGYNGAPARLEHCLEIGCLREQQSVPSGERHELCRGLHGEQNAIIQAAYHGVAIRGATLYCTNHPCVICSKMLINAGIERIVYEEGYADDLAGQMLKESGIKVARFKRRLSATLFPRQTKLEHK
jgi:dCMP deaminase